MDFDMMIEVLNYGGFAVLAVAFLLVLVMLWRRGEKSDKAIDGLTKRSDTADALLDVVRSNTAAMQCVKAAVHENSRIIERLDLDFGKKLEELSRDIRELRERV